MKRLFLLFIVLITILSLAACGESNVSSSNNDSTDATQNNGGAENKDAELFDIPNTAIIAKAEDLVTNLTGDEASAQIAKIPAEIKKGVGEVGAGLCTIHHDTVNGSYNFGAIFYVPKDSLDEYWKVLTDHYKSLGGNITSDTEIGTTKILNIEFSWGTMYQCETGSFNEENASITVGFKINADSGNNVSGDSGDSWGNAAYATYTNDVPEPAFNYTIKGVIMDQLTVNAEATADEVNTWKQSLLDAGFEEYREGEMWGVKNESVNVQMNGFVGNIAYIYIGLE